MTRESDVIVANEPIRPFAPITAAEYARNAIEQIMRGRSRATAILSRAFTKPGLLGDDGWDDVPVMPEEEYEAILERRRPVQLTPMSPLSPAEPSYPHLRPSHMPVMGMGYDIGSQLAETILDQTDHDEIVKKLIKKMPGGGEFELGMAIGFAQLAMKKAVEKKKPKLAKVAKEMLKRVSKKKLGSALGFLISTRRTKRR